MQAHSYKNPLEYSKNSQLQAYFAKQLMTRLSIKVDDRILDIGCGDGKITKDLAEMVPTGYVIGTDISAEMINFASKTYHTQKNLKFMQMDAIKNIFRNQFDLVISFNCLHWVSNQEEALCGISNALVENGRIGLLFSHRKSAIHFVMENICASSCWQKYFTSAIIF